MPLKDKKEVIKASPAIQIENKPNLLQRRAWNWLLRNAYEDLPREDKYSVSIKELAEALEFNSKNEEYLKKALRGLVQCTVEWNILNKDQKNEWGVHKTH